MNKQQKIELIKAFNLFVTIFNKWLEKQATCDEQQEEKHKRDKNGRFAKNGGNNSAILSETDKEIEEKINQLKNIDWNKDNILPKLNKDILKQYGLKDKPVLLKKNIIEKNKLNHPDITNDEAIRIIGNALYKTETVLKGNINKHTYHNFITRTDDEHSDIVLLELSDEKENYEIINYHIIRNVDRQRKEKLHQNIINKNSQDGRTAVPSIVSS